MLRSLYSGISGLRAHQQMMDNTANNIANVNTTGYKSSQTVFQDTLSQMVNAAGDIKLPIGISLAPVTTDNITLTGNFSYEAPIDATGATAGSQKVIPITVIDANGASQAMPLTFNKSSATSWDVSLPDGTMTT